MSDGKEIDSEFAQFPEFDKLVGDLRSFLQEKPVDPHADATYWRARAEKAETAFVEMLENARETINGMLRKNHELNVELRKDESAIEGWLERNQAQMQEIERLTGELEACQALVARMHEAAVGEVTGPRRGVVEDIADLRALAIKQEDQLNRILQPGERWLELAQSYKDSGLSLQWLGEHFDVFALARARTLEAIEDTLKEMVKR